MEGAGTPLARGEQPLADGERFGRIVRAQRLRAGRNACRRDDGAHPRLAECAQVLKQRSGHKGHVPGNDEERIAFRRDQCRPEPVQWPESFLAVARDGHAGKPERRARVVGHDDLPVRRTAERGERAIDDARVAEAIARTESTVRKRGRLRVQMQIERAGIARTTARRAVDETFEGIDDAALLEAALAKRLRGRQRIEDDREMERLYRYLVSQGFEPDRVLAALKRIKD